MGWGSRVAALAHPVPPLTTKHSFCDKRALRSPQLRNEENDLAILLTSGFAAASTNTAQSPLPKASIKKITNANSGQLIAEANTMANVQSWQGRWQVGAGAWQAADCVKMTRKMTIINLTPGTMYTIEMRGVGGSTGFGDWSDPVSHMAM